MNKAKINIPTALSPSKTSLNWQVLLGPPPLPARGVGRLAIVMTEKLIKIQQNQS